jgi:HEAT repeat protein
LPVGLAAISALSAAGTPAALDALFQLVEGWDDDVLAASALGALGEDGRPEVRQRMRALLSAAKSKDAILRLLQVASGLLSDTIEEDFKLFCLHDDRLVRRRSAELIVDHMGASGIPVLIQLLSDPAVLESVRARLELITCYVLPATGHLETQRAYTEWWDAHQREAPSQWFLRALQRTGQVRGDVEGILKDKRRDPSAIKTLVDLIEKTESWQLRVRAHKALNRLCDTPIRPALRRHSTQGDITLAVKRWRKWLDRVRAGLAK